MNRRTKPEVLAPAGNLRGLKTAVDFGADAVYCGGKAFGMRSAPKNLTLEDFEEGSRYAHERGARVYVTCNILPRNAEVKAMREYIGQLKDTGVDALIVTDIGILMEARRIAPELELHVSTQAGVTNWGAANALYELGARRVVLAREMDMQAVRDIRANIPADMDVECFVHGSMCMAFSGRCLISNYLTGRDGNHGECAQPCRWKYSLVEEKRPGQVFPIEETAEGTYLFNSQDMCMMEHLDELIDSGATSLKIEGRAKSAYYIAAITNAYRTAVDEYMVQRGFESRDGEILRPFHDRVVVPGQPAPAWLLDERAAAADVDAAVVADADPSVPTAVADGDAPVDAVLRNADAAFSGVPDLVSEDPAEPTDATASEGADAADTAVVADLVATPSAATCACGRTDATQSDGCCGGHDDAASSDGCCGRGDGSCRRADADAAGVAESTAPSAGDDPLAPVESDESGWIHARVVPAPKVTLPDWLKEEPYKVAHRDYSTGFYYPEQKVVQNTDRSAYFRSWLIVGEVLDWTADEGGRVTIMSRNKIEAGQEIEFLLPGRAPLAYTVPGGAFRDENGEPVDAINNPAHVFSFPCSEPVPHNAAIRSRTKRPTLKAA
ncbi:peptidase U32 family protein [Bifidobacterium samirii]|nr:U32 family peptidase [Bifidobacterium samirii]